ncbi:hypothetical protein [Streptomyces sp. NPDC047939]|uniref:hypothetical protein n=1 Tax=Streptomyces sp. NPDC047939 TaxID=3155381 RepID=UPI00343512BE
MTYLINSLITAVFDLQNRQNAALLVCPLPTSPHRTGRQGECAAFGADVGNPGVRTHPARVPCGTYASNFRLSEFSNDVPGFIVRPNDLIGTERHPDLMRSMGCCQGPAGGHGLNLVCRGCGAEVATGQADC